MQLMWISGPCGKVHSISITKRGILMALSGISLFLVLLGGVINFMGLHVALQFSPGLARSLGGVATAEELSRSEARYRESLLNLQDKLSAAAKQLTHLEGLKERFMQLATPQGLSVPTGKDMGKGGPLILPEFDKRQDDSLSEDIQGSMQKFEQFNQSLSDMDANWQKELSWLEYLPTGLPVKGNYSLSSRFGMRIDPFTHRLARHDGLDFNANIGDPVLAAAGGTVIRARFSPEYGNTIDIDHGNGYVSRYGHAQRLLVTEGQKVERGAKIALAGSTGRSSGPHVHFEVLHHGIAENPERFVARRS